MARTKKEEETYQKEFENFLAGARELIDFARGANLLTDIRLTYGNHSYSGCEFRYYDQIPSLDLKFSENGKIKGPSLKYKINLEGANYF